MRHGISNQILKDIMGAHRVAHLTRDERERMIAQISQVVERYGAEGARSVLKDQKSPEREKLEMHTRLRERNAQEAIAQRPVDLHAATTTVLHAATINSILTSGEEDPDEEDPEADHENDGDSPFEGFFSLKPPRPSWA